MIDDYIIDDGFVDDPHALNAEHGDEHIPTSELLSRLEQIKAANKLASQGKLTEVERLRVHNKIVPGLGDDMKRVRDHAGWVK